MQAGVGMVQQRRRGEQAVQQALQREQQGLVARAEEAPTLKAQRQRYSVRWWTKSGSLDDMRPPSQPSTDVLTEASAWPRQCTPSQRTQRCGGCEL